MTVTVRPYKNTRGWEVDIVLKFPGRRKIRERRKAPVSTKSAAKRWGEDRERQLIEHYNNTDPAEDDKDDRPDLVKKEVPTLAAFFPRYMEGYCKSNRHRPAMAGAPARAIQKLAGHQSVVTTERYMSLSPVAIEESMRLLNRRPAWRNDGDGDGSPLNIQ